LLNRDTVLIILLNTDTVSKLIRAHALLMISNN